MIDAMRMQLLFREKVIFWLKFQDLSTRESHVPGNEKNQEIILLMNKWKRGIWHLKFSRKMIAAATVMH